MTDVRTLDTLKSVSIKTGKTVDSVAGQARVTGTTWDPNAGVESRAKAEFEAYEAFKKQREEELNADPTLVRIAQLERKVQVLEEIVLGVRVNG